MTGNKLRGLAGGALCLGILAGCGEQAVPDEGKSPYAEAVSMEETPVIDYQVPTFRPNILVDMQGYCLGERQTAALKGSRLPEEFSLVDVATGETVYTGEVEEITYSKELGFYTGYADFGGYTEPGEYYLQCDVIGNSYSFRIAEELYDSLFAETYELLRAECADNAMELGEVVTLLQVYEWYAEVFPDADRNRIPDVLETIRSWIACREESSEPAAEEALYAALLAKFSYTYQKYDFQYATDCLQRASTVLSRVPATTGRDADSFLALTELYRATGLSVYRNQIAEYKSFFENNSSYLEEQEYLYGAMTYLVTRQKVDVELCDTFMSGLMDRAEEISNRYEKMIHPMNAKNNGSADLLKNASIISCANFCMNNYQYTNICEEFLHYLMGRNRESVDFYESDENRTGYLLLLAGLAAKSGQEG